MPEIDHTATPSPEPAKPILASDLLELELKQRQRFSGRGESISTGCKEIDDYLLGGEGLERGIVVGISGESAEGRLITVNLIASVLLPHLGSPFQLNNSKATVIDTTGSFPLGLLARVIKSRILASGNQSGGNIGEEVKRCLEMVAISRVFDIEGLWEVLGDISHSSVPDSSLTSENEPLKPATIPGTEDSEDEITPPEVTIQNSAIVEEGTEIVVVDTLTQIITELFTSREKSAAHVLLTSLSNAIYSLTHTQNILTLLHNTSIPISRPDPSSTRTSVVPTPSIFSGNPKKPSLGKLFEQFTDLHLFLSPLPRSSSDATILYNQTQAQEWGFEREVEYATVLEVISDSTPNIENGEKGKKRFGSREHRWCAVKVREDGLGLIEAFQREEKRGGLVAQFKDVGSVAKIYGFGGRSV